MSLTQQKCKAEIDQVYAEATQDRVPRPPVFDANGKKLAAQCPSCDGKSTDRVCPGCHSRLPVEFGKIGSQLIAMVGARESGKTVFMTVLIHELFHRVGAEFGAAVDGSDEHTRAQFAASYEEKLYDKGELFFATRSAAGELVKPLVFRFTRKSGTQARQTRVHTLLSFFDTAGEDLQSEDRVHLNTRYLLSAHGVILLLDPLQMPGARALTGPNVRLPKKGTALDDPINVLTRVTDLLRTRPGHKPGHAIKVPLAVAFTKIDALWDHLPPGSPLLADRPLAAHQLFDTRDSRNLHHNVQALLHSWDGGQIDRHLGANYETFRYFGVSSLGETPTVDNRVASGGIRPHRIADPLLWLLSEMSVIQATAPSHV